MVSADQLSDLSLRRQLRRTGDPLIVHQGAIGQIAAKQLGHIVTHQGENDQIGAKANVKAGGKSPVKAGCQRADKQDQGDKENPRQRREVPANQGRHDGAYKKLALCSQVHHSAALGKGKGQSGEQKRSRIAQGSEDRIDRAKGTLKNQLIGLQGVESGHVNNNAANYQRQKKCHQCPQDHVHRFLLSQKSHVSHSFPSCAATEPVISMPRRLSSKFSARSTAMIFPL